MKINKRDVKFFILGIVTAMLVGLLLDFDNNIKDFKDGFMNGLKGDPPQVEEVVGVETDANKG